MSDFLCGVVEGFYGRPWTIQQRRELFERLKNFGLNTYMYAPKDDEKHRSLWRELYDDAEGRVLRQLASSADQNDVAFIYALSPGIDIRYSDDSELETLKRKLQQVASFGVRRFALLFDDIEPQLNEADAQRFASFAHAHCQVTNTMYNSMLAYFHAEGASHKAQADSDADEQQGGQLEKQDPCMPVFLFCPTEYCSSRCVPNLSESHYLRTVGSLLDPRINLMWTGPQVVSRTITSAHLEELFNVTRRRCVIWDNLPANDYDQRRLFLGPFSGRSDVRSMSRFARGLLVNPNCEFEANFVPLRTLASWYHLTLCETDSSASKEANVPHVETEAQVDARPEVGSRYSPTRALLDAIREWLAVMRTPKTAAGFCISTPHHLASPQSICNSGESQSTANKRERSQDDEELPVQPAEAERVETAREQDVDGFSEYDVHLVVDFFNLPFEYGENALQMLESFRWLRDNAEVLRVDDERQPDPNAPAPPNRQSPPAAASLSPVQLELECNDDALSPQSQSATSPAECVQMRDVDERARPSPRPTAAEWRAKAANFREMVQRANSLSSKVTRLRNRALAYDLNPYVTELYGTLWVCRSYVDWLAMRRTDSRCRETFFAGEHEPWLVRGGVLGELQRAVPENDRCVNNARPTRAAPGESPARSRLELEAEAGVTTPEQMQAAPSNISAEPKPTWPQNESTSCSVIRPLLYSELDEERQIANWGASSFLRFANNHPESVACFVLESPDGKLGACCVGLLNANTYRAFATESGTQETQHQQQAEAHSPFQYLNDERYPSFVKLLISPDNERPNGELVRLLRCTLNNLRVNRRANVGVYTVISNNAPFGVAKHISLFEQVGLLRVRGEPPKSPNYDEQNAATSRMDSDGTQPTDCESSAAFLACTL